VGIRLLQHTELVVDPFTACLELQGNFVACSDGSSISRTDGSFGWIISTIQGEQVASGMGPSRGSVMDSYCAECSGMLAVLRFLIRIAAYTDMVGQWCGTIGADSQSMLDTIFGQEKGSRPVLRTPISLSTQCSPLDPLIPEWDLLVEIRKSLGALPDVVKLVYVKGHQDKHRAYARLSLLAHLNVDLDDMAGQYQQDHGRAYPYTLIMPNTGVYKVYPEGTRKANYVQDIRSRSTGPALRL
jgi:hypothetical protein